MRCSGCLDGDNQVLWKSDTHFIKKEILINRYREIAHIPEPCGHYCHGIDKGQYTRFLGSWSISTDCGSFEMQGHSLILTSLIILFTDEVVFQTPRQKDLHFKLGESSVGTVYDKDDRLLGGLCWNSPENPKKGRHHSLCPLHTLSFTSLRCGLAMPR